MAGYLTPVGKATALNALAGVGLYVGLAQTLGLDSPPTLTNISEVVTAGYSREAVTWTSATVADTFLNNTAATQFGPVTADMPPAAYAFLTNAASGTSLDAPVATLGATAGTGGTFAAGTYYWTVTALNSMGETVSSNEVSGAVALDGTQTITWTAPTVNPAGTAYDVSSYNVYRGTASGQENVLVGNVAAGTLTFTDTGAAGTAQNPPTLSSAAVGDIFYIWALAEPVSALANKPVYVPANGLIIE